MLQSNIELINGQLKQIKKRVPKFVIPRKQDDMHKAVRAFLNGRVGKFGKYFATENALVYRTVSVMDGNAEMLEDIIALRIDRLAEVIYIGNSSMLSAIDRQVSFGREVRRRGDTAVQRLLAQLIPMLPFTVFQQAGLDLFAVNLLDRTPEETITRRGPDKYNSRTKKNEKTFEDVHFTGASLFEVNGRCFLFDVDRREIKHKIFNPFLVELKTQVQTIAEAYEALKPQEVKDAEAAGLEVLRQGEWFFIPLNKKFKTIKALRESGQWNALEKGYQTIELRAGNNRPNRVSRAAGLVSRNKYDMAEIERIDAVTGFVEHAGREHAKLDLPGWYKPVPNTSIQSFTITGDID
jgi:hypothetical protein